MGEAETLRKAAALMRDEWGPTRGWTVQDFHLAVADLLDYEANKDEALKRYGSRGHDGESWCVKVATAYLGDRP